MSEPKYETVAEIIADRDRLRRIEQAAREVLEQVKDHPEYLYVITDPRKASAALNALRQALGSEG